MVPLGQRGAGPGGGAEESCAAARALVPMDRIMSMVKSAPVGELAMVAEAAVMIEITPMMIIPMVVVPTEQANPDKRGEAAA